MTATGKRFWKIEKCRICGNKNLKSVINLGNLCLSGIFPKDKDTPVVTGPLELVKCHRQGKKEFCGLTQLRHSYNKHLLYGKTYGYRSGLNSSMVNHLKDVVNKVFRFVNLKKGDLIIDIGSSDGTLLGFYPQTKYKLAGIDPSASKYKKFYPPGVKIINNFFFLQTITKTFGSQKAKIITSIAMFYDLENPLEFIKEITKVLDDKGVWVLEQSYLPLMLRVNAYDTICHEHTEYYCLRDIKWMLDRTGLKILDIELNDTNGGSFKLTVAKNSSPQKECTEVIQKMLAKEQALGLDTLKPFIKFKKTILNHKKDLLELINKLIKQNKKIIGYGASTKGNIILQYCGLSSKQIPYIAEVNQDKFGCFTPKTHIPIISEQQAKSLNPDYLLVFPWHFKDYFLIRERKFLKSGKHLIFPLPQILII